MSAPERIYLQWFEDDAAKYMPEGVTWCDDRIEDDDVEYVRADKAAAEIETGKTVINAWIAENSRGGWIDDLRVKNEALSIETQTLRAVLSDILAAGPIKEDEYPLLLARAKAALGGGA